MTEPQRPPDLRVGSEERESAMGALDTHHRAGRLDDVEYARRSATAAAATVRSELDGLFADLPLPRPVFPSSPWPDAGRAGPARSGPAEPSEDRTVDLPELIEPLAARVGRHAGLLMTLSPLFGFALVAATGFRFPFLALLVPVMIGVLAWLGRRQDGAGPG